MGLYLAGADQPGQGTEDIPTAAGSQQNGTQSHFCPRDRWAGQCAGEPHVWGVTNIPDPVNVEQFITHLTEDLVAMSKISLLIINSAAVK